MVKSISLKQKWPKAELAHAGEGGKKHFTKAEIVARQKQEEGLRTYTKYHPNDKVKQAPAALRMFEKLKKHYKDIDYVEGLDENVINNVT